VRVALRIDPLNSSSSPSDMVNLEHGLTYLAFEISLAHTHQDYRVS
jgi:hypothetical protein